MAAPMLLDGEPVCRRSSPRHSTTSIIYKPLIREEAEIRLLTLHPDQFGEDIRCSLHTVSLTNSPQYDALSYVWGDPEITLPVIVDGREKQVTTSLEAALRYLRWQEKPRIFWVDAICLDQDNIKEKNVQVPMMGEVYHQATSVIVWLGHGLGYVEDAIKWAHHHASKQTSRASPELEDDVLTAELDMARFSVLVLGFLHLLRHRYWHRMWTYQEFVLAADMPICVYGHLSFSLPTVTKAFQAFQCEVHSIQDEARSLDEEFKPIFYSMLRELTEFNENATAMRNLDNLGEGIRYESFTHGSLFYPLLYSVGRESSNPRDRIYALYGLCPGLSRALPIDYSKTKEQVILEAIALMVRSGEFGYLWATFELRTDRFSSVKELPSWTPNLDRCRIFPVRQHNLRVLTFREVAVEADHLSSDLIAFHLWAWSLGCCKVLQRITSNGHDDTVSKPRLTETKISIQLSAFVDGLWADEVGSISHVLCQKFARCAVAGVEGHEQTSDADLVKAFRAVCLDTSLVYCDQDAKYKSRALELVARCGFTLGDVACIITSSGCVGFAPFDTEDNDLVVLPRYPAPPMVLRKEFADLSQAGRESYLMVGSANVSAAGAAKGDDFETVVSNVRGLGVAEYLIH